MCGGCCKRKDQEEDDFQSYYTQSQKSGRIPVPIVNRDLYNQEAKNNNYDLTITKIISPASGSPISSKSLSPVESKHNVPPGYQQTTHLRLVKQVTSTNTTKVKEVPKERRHSEDFSTHRLYVSNLKKDMTIPELSDIFPGNSNILVKRSKRRGTTAVVQFEDPADCEAAYLRVKGTVINGQPIVVSPKLKHEILLD